MTQLYQKMALCNTYRLFAIYLVIVATIAQSPVSAFAFGRVRTTTLRPLADLAGEESALLEVKRDSSKLNNERDNVKYGRYKTTVRKSANFLTPDRKISSTSRNSDTTSTPDKLLHKLDEPTMLPTEITIRKETETTTGFTTEETDSIETNDEYLSNALSDKGNIKALAAEPNQDDYKPNDNSSATELVTKDDVTKLSKQSFLQNKTNDIVKNDKPDNFTTSTDTTKSTTIDMKDTETTINDETGTETSTMIINDSYSITTNSKEPNTEESSTSTVTHNDDTSLQTDATNTETESTQNTEKDNISTALTGRTETMIGESSSSSTKNPSWRKYTVIERKRLITTTEAESTSTEKSDELENAESISKITIENAIGVTPIDSLEELRQELISNSKTTTNQNENALPSTTKPSYDIPEPENDRPSSTQSISSDKTGETKSDYLATRRAGYLDFSTKQHNEREDSATTERLDGKTTIQTELPGSMIETKPQEIIGSVTARNTDPTPMAESQRQLVDDAIKEELLEEEVLNDRIQNARRFENIDKSFQDSNEGTDDSLSVKPIAHGKGSLYAVNTNYKKMKKIEVQPAKPFVRHPDDNSWRNESLTSLGIVFKAKNASKPFTEVLKNKTEAELNNVTEKENKNEVPDLRVRLGKIAEVRKSKKKKIDKFGDTVYSDYEESSSEASSTPKTDTVSIPIMEVEGEIFFASLLTTPSPATEATSQRTTTPGVYMHKEETVTTKRPKKVQKFSEYYDTSDEYDYINLSKIDLKKFTTRLFGKDEKTVTTSPFLSPFTKPMKSTLPERKPTVQYFPPRAPPQKVNFNDYDTDFRRKVNMYTVEKVPKEAHPVSHSTPPPATVITERPPQRHNLKNVLEDTRHPHMPGNLDKNIYGMIPPRPADHIRYQGSNDESFNRASYVIKHYKDLINEAVKDDYDKSAEFMSTFTESPLVGVTAIKENDRPKPHMDADYEDEFRKDILSRFVDNFNQNSERFKVDFPILYNNSVVHSKTQDSGKVVASSSAFMKRLYGGDPPEAREPLFQRPCEPHCEVKVELSPAYELHYYVPEQEEKEEVALNPASLPFSYRL